MSTLETFPNNHPGRDYTITHTAPEFSAARLRRMSVEGNFNPRGGISSVVAASYEAPRKRKR